MDTTPSPTPRPDDRDSADDDTRRVETTPTQGYAVAQQTRADDDDHAKGYQAFGGDATAYPMTPTAPPEPMRPTGTSWATVVLGILALVIGGLVLAFQLIDVRIDWAIATPAVFVGAGGVLVLLGVAALVSRRKRDHETG